MDGSLTIFIGGPLLPVGRIVSSFHFFPCRLGYFSKNGETTNLDFILILVFLHSPSPERNCWPIVPRSLFGGSHRGERQVLSLKIFD